MRCTILLALLLIAATFAFPPDQEKALKKFFAAVGRTTWQWPVNITCSFWAFKCNPQGELTSIGIGSSYSPIGELPPFVLTHFPTLETINFPDSRLNGSLVQGTHFPDSVKNLYVQGSVITELGLSAAGMTVDASNIKTLKKINVEKGANITSIRLTLSKAESLVIRGTVMVLYSENLGLNTLDIANGVTLGEVWLNGGNVTKVNWNFNFEDLHLSNNQITDATLVQGYSYGHLDLQSHKSQPPRPHEVL